MGEVGHTFDMHYVYILQDEQKKLYVGYSNDLKQRLKDHQYKKVATTSIYQEPSLIWYCAFTDKKGALDFERYLKAGSGHAFAKKHLIK
jgi:predicted GIY-YIG superfamily endonuclease